MLDAVTLLIYLFILAKTLVFIFSSQCFHVYKNPTQYKPIRYDKISTEIKWERQRRVNEENLLRLEAHFSIPAQILTL